MKRVMLLISAALLSILPAAAQYDNDSSSQNQAPPYKTTITGCIDGALGQYTITDHGGASYVLRGNPEQLKAHVGETARITGEVTPIVHVPGAMSAGTQTQPELKVLSLKRISGVCSDADEIP